MNPITRHLLIPAIAPLLIVALYFTPLTLIGCYNRGLIAVTIVFVSLVAGLVAAVFGIRARMKGDPAANWWIMSVAVLTIPALLVLGPLG